MTNTTRQQRLRQQQQQQQRRRDGDCSSLSFKDNVRLPLLVLSLLLLVETAAALSVASPIRSTRTPQVGTRRLPVVSTSTRLQFRDDHELDVKATTSSSTSSRWWKSFVSANNEATVEEDSSQASVDDYLEFLDRRYHRLHDEDDGAGEVKFSAWKWLTHGDSTTTTEQSVLAQQQDESKTADALYVLGVAGLASQRLLQKKKVISSSAVLVGEVKRQIKSITDAEIETASNKPSSSSLVESTAMTPASLLLVRLAPLLRRLSSQRKQFIRYQATQLAALLQKLAKTLANGIPEAVRSLWRMGGGKKNVVLTLTAVAAISVLVVRPLAQAIVSEARV